MSETISTDAQDAFWSAATTFGRLVADVPTAALDGPGLGDWDLRSLIGHAARSLVTVETYLDQPADAVEVATAADYYLAIRRMGLDPADVTERGRAAGLAMGEDPAAWVGALTDRVRAKLPGYDPAYVMTTIAGGMTLAEYLRTRVFELVVHGLDIARATGLAASYDVRPLADATSLAAQLAAVIAVGSGGAPDLLMSLTGRDVPAPRLSVV